MPLHVWRTVFSRMAFYRSVFYSRLHITVPCWYPAYTTASRNFTNLEGKYDKGPAQLNTRPWLLIRRGLTKLGRESPFQPNNTEAPPE